MILILFFQLFYASVYVKYEITVYILFYTSTQALKSSNTLQSSSIHIKGNHICYISSTFFHYFVNIFIIFISHNDSDFNGCLIFHYRYLLSTLR